MHWYRDRDFPEVKRPRFNEPAEILAVVPDTQDLDRIIKAHNDEMDFLLEDIVVRKEQYLEQLEFAADLEASLVDKRRLTRELDKALFGADAAIQASLCDLIEPARKLRVELDRYKRALKDIVNEQILGGNPIGERTKYENPLSISLRNIALEALVEE